MSKKENRVRFFLKRVFLKMLGYKNAHKYWEAHWRLSPYSSKLTLESDQKLLEFVRAVMNEYGCDNIIDIGCGRGYCRELPGYLGIDFSFEGLKKSELPEFLFADMTRRIPLPDKTFDAAFVSAVLIHIPSEKIEKAVSEISRVVKKVIILNEPPYGMGDLNRKSHVFSHNLVELFSKHFSGDLIFVNENLRIKGCSLARCGMRESLNNS